jgi:Tfp pilus assembly protein FimV
MAAPFLIDTDFPPHIARPTAARPSLVVIDGGRSEAARARRRSEAQLRRLAARRQRRTYLVRRLAVAVVGLVLVGSGVSVVSSLVGAGAPTAGTTYEVGAGDTLWSIAGSLDLGADRRQVVAMLAAANGGSTVVRPGQHLVVPAEVIALG